MKVIRRRECIEMADCPGDLHPLLRRLYAARSIANAADLQLSLEHLIPVRQLGGINAAVELLCRHHQQRSRIVIVGDFDADGATSTALVVRQLTRLGFVDVNFLVPNRFEYGYGLTPEIVKLAVTRFSPALILTVDNGMSSHAGVTVARSLGIDTLITDHHLAAATLPDANAIVNPNAPGDAFPSKALAGVGVAFYLMAALTRELQARGIVSTHPRLPICSIWWRSAPLRTSCHWIATTGCSFIRACDAFARGDVRQAFAPCSKQRIGCTTTSLRRISVIRSVRA